MTHTHTFAILEVSQSTFDDIADYATLDDDGSKLIILGLGLVALKVEK